MNCPICSNKLKETGKINPIFNRPLFFCDTCVSWHIIENVDVSTYYKEEYHKNYQYKINFLRKLNLTGNRAIANYAYFNKNFKISIGEEFIEIGGGTGDKFIIFNKKKKPKQYVIIEPDVRFNINKPNVAYMNNLFNEVNSENLNPNSIVIMFHVLEHVFDLNSFFEKLKSIKPKCFYFEVPNCNNQKVREDSFINHPHFHHFTKKSVSVLLEKNGLKKLSLDEIEPISYHPYIKPNKIMKYVHRIFAKHEEIKENGIYLRGIYKFSD
jgi:hypothetical protein